MSCRLHVVIQRILVFQIPLSRFYIIQGEFISVFRVVKLFVEPYVLLCITRFFFVYLTLKVVWFSGFVPQHYSRVCCVKLIHITCDVITVLREIASSLDQETIIIYIYIYICQFRNVCPSVHLSAWKNSATRLPMDGFLEISYLNIFENLSRKFSFHYNRAKVTNILQEG